MKEHSLLEIHYEMLILFLSILSDFLLFSILIFYLFLCIIRLFYDGNHYWKILGKRGLWIRMMGSRGWMGWMGVWSGSELGKLGVIRCWWLLILCFFRIGFVSRLLLCGYLDSSLSSSELEWDEARSSWKCVLIAFAMKQVYKKGHTTWWYSSKWYDEQENENTN